MYNPLLKDDPGSLSDQQIEDKIAKLNKSLNNAYATNSMEAVNQLRNLLNLYLNEQIERMDIQMFKQMCSTANVISLTVEDEIEPEETADKPKVEEKEGGKLSLFRKIMNQQNEQK
jgi:hypothetical protein